MSNRFATGAILLVNTVLSHSCAASNAPIAELPANFQLGAIACQPAAAVIVGWEDKVARPGETGFLQTEAVAFRVSAADGSLHRVPLGSGVATSISLPGGTVAYLVRRETFPDRPEGGTLFISSDSGVTWKPVDTAPTHLIGVAFEAPDSGYVWSETEVFRTVDRGATWRAVASPGRIPRSFATPVVDRRGNLWIASGYGPSFDRQHNRISRVRPDLTVDVEVEGADFMVRTLEASSAGDLWLLTTADSNAGPVQLRRLAHGRKRDAVVPVADLPGALPITLRVFGSDIVAVMATLWSNVPDAFLMVSHDQGASWARVAPQERQLQSMCFITPDSSWIVGPVGRVFAPK